MTTARKQTDVLIVGGGLAALRAAIAAREAGASTTVVVKGMLGRSGSSAITSGGFAAVVPGLTEGDSPAEHAADTLRAGVGVGDPELVDLVCRQAAAEVETVTGYGGRFFREPDGSLYVEPSGEHGHARILVPESRVGIDFTVPMTEYARRIGVEVFESTMCLAVLASDKTVQGAVCLDLKEGRLLAFEAPSVILCTGGCGNLFSRTSNPRDVTGDGYAIAAEAGAELVDMEFIQFYPWRCVRPFDKARVSVQPSTFVVGGKLLNADGERFMERYDPQRLDATTRDIAARGIYDQIRSGRAVDGGVRLDLSDMSEETFRRYNPKMWNALQARRLDWRDTEFIIAPEAHYVMGGVRIDSDGHSGISGLYAAGETAGGIHGANRANSNALPEILVFGARAGRQAAASARRRPRSAELDGHPSLRFWEEALARCEDGSEGDKMNEERCKLRLGELRRTMDDALGIIRDPGTMQAGLDHVRRLQDELLADPPRRISGFRAWSELRMLARVAELCLTAAIHRKESRGAHYRDDCPAPDKRLDGVSYAVALEEGRPVVRVARGADNRPDESQASASVSVGSKD